MVFNGSKFQLVRYGQDQDLNTLNFTEKTKKVIERFEVLGDLGVQRSDTATFETHIDPISKKVRHHRFYEKHLQFSNFAQH